MHADLADGPWGSGRFAPGGGGIGRDAVAARGQGGQADLHGLALAGRAVFAQANWRLVIDLNHHMGPDPQSTAIVQRPVLHVELEGPVATGQVGPVDGDLDRDPRLAVGQRFLQLLHGDRCGHFLQQP